MKPGSTNFPDHRHADRRNALALEAGIEMTMQDTRSRFDITFSGQIDDGQESSAKSD